MTTPVKLSSSNNMILKVFQRTLSCLWVTSSSSSLSCSFMSFIVIMVSLLLLCPLPSAASNPSSQSQGPQSSSKSFPISVLMSSMASQLRSNHLNPSTNWHFTRVSRRPRFSPSSHNFIDSNQRRVVNLNSNFDHQDDVGGGDEGRMTSTPPTEENLLFPSSSLQLSSPDLSSTSKLSVSEPLSSSNSRSSKQSQENTIPILHEDVSGEPGVIPVRETRDPRLYDVPQIGKWIESE